MLRSAKKALLPVSPATRSRISSSVNPANRRSSSLETTDITLGASESFCANLDAVVTLVLNSGVQIHREWAARRARLLGVVLPQAALVGAILRQGLAETRCRC